MTASRRRGASAHLDEAVAHLELAQRYAAGDLSDQLVIDAICMRLSAAIEALSQVDDQKRDELFGSDWPLMWGMRNRIAHGYMLVDAVIVRTTVNTDVPNILQRIKASAEQSSAD